MIHKAASLFFLATMVALALAPARAADEAAPVEVAVLGVYHFSGGGSDAVTTDQDDHRSPRRQAEIAQVIDLLARFAPTKILVEVPVERQADLDAEFRAYAAGGGGGDPSEIQQLAMRLASRLGHRGIHAVDYRNMVDFDLGLASATPAQQAGFGRRMESVQALAQSIEAPGSSVLERLQLVNSRSFDAVHGLYLLLAQMNGDSGYRGADQAALWWTRNLRIFANMARIAEPGDRVLVIYGAGHKLLLERFVTDTPGWTLVSTDEILGVPQAHALPGQGQETGPAR